MSVLFDHTLSYTIVLKLGSEVILSQSHICSPNNTLLGVVAWVRGLVAGLTPRKPGVNPEQGTVRFALEGVPMEQGFHQVLGLSLWCFIIICLSPTL